MVKVRMNERPHRKTDRREGSKEGVGANKKHSELCKTELPKNTKGIGNICRNI